MSEQPKELKSKRIDESVFEADARREIEKLEEPLSGELIIAAKNISTYGRLQKVDWFLYGWMKKQLDTASREYDNNEGTNPEIMKMGARLSFYVDCIFVKKMSPAKARAAFRNEYMIKRSTVLEYDHFIREIAVAAANQIFEDNHIPQHYVLRSTRIVLESITNF